MPVPATDLGPLLAAHITAPSTVLGPSTLPLMLFPVRLETRVFPLATVAEIRIRVYPDKIQLNAHDPALTAGEISAGQVYWRAVWPLSIDNPAALRAWQILAGQAGSPRAAWIVKRLTPTNLAQRPAGTPKFPDPGPPATTPRTPTVALMPDRWVASAFIGTTLAASVTGHNIVPNLAIAPDLAAPVVINDETPAIDDGMRWMIDFDTAEQAGMALRLQVPLPGAVDLLLVTGVGHGDRSAEVAAQLDAHHYTDGLEFLAPATPTNNTAAGRAPYREPDPTHEISYAREIRPATPVTGSYAQLMSLALGVDSFGHIGGAGNTDVLTATAMATALWPATWGYFLSQMIGFSGTGLTAANRDDARGHAVAFVRPGGPLPVLRAGAQPYGVLPVTSLDAWLPRPADTTFIPVRSLIVALREVVWRVAAARVPRIGNTDDPSTDLANVLQTGALSTDFAVRGLMGQHFLEHLRAFLTTSADSPDYWPTLAQLTGAISAAIGLGATPALNHAVHEDTAHSVRTPLVGAPSYIADLLAVTNLDALAAPVPAAADPLLKVLLRHALLRAYADAAARLLNQASTPTELLLRDQELIDLVPGQPPAPTWQRQRDSLVPGTTTTVRNRLNQTPGTEITQLRTALGVLAQADVPTLERHLCGTLDATSHRFDAWVTSFATRRLTEQRLAHPTGLTIGGYGWVENLHPQPAGQMVDPLPGEPAPLATVANDPGFIHAPSLNQASAAALLRGAHLTHGGAPESPFAIELTSGRIRLVRQLFEGVRQGQPLGALLGYTVERRLHDGALDDLIDPLRSLAPLPGAATPTGVRRLVVDGLALSTIWRSNRDRVLNLLPSTDLRRQTAATIMDGLVDAVDAASDAVQAEAAFQMVRGNMTRATNSLDAISTGQVPPPDLGFLKTPRTGVGVSHRVAVLLPASPAAPGHGWATTSVRAVADPALNAWAGRLLGPADAISARVEELDDAGAVTATHVVALPALGLAPIDLVWATAGADGAPTEIIQRVLAAAPASTAQLRVNLGRAGAQRGLGDLIEVATNARRFLGGARPMDGADLQAPHADPVRGLDLDEYDHRATAAEQALTAVRTALAAALDNGSGLRQPMLNAAAFGIAGAIPVAENTLVPQARALLVELDRRLGLSITPPPHPGPPAAAPTDDAGRRDSILARFRTVFGPGFLALPRFTAANANDLVASLADAASLRAGDPLAAYTWLLRMERVRPALTRLGRPLREAEALGTGESLNLSIAQLPHVPGQRWLGLPLATDTKPPDGRVSLVIQSVPGDVRGQLCGIVADEWTELIPSRTETTGIAFHYEPPDSVAPQAILLAVPPVLGQQWTVGSLNRVLMETLDLARLRGVGHQALGDITHFVPATYLAFNLNADAVSTDLTALTAP
jgi:hypothetical protein